MPLIVFPNVPLALGVPRVARPAGFIGGAIQALTGLAGTLLDLSSNSQWGLFNDRGQPAISFDTFMAVEERVEERLPTYQIEEGGFGTYNKVAQPYEGKISLAQGGSIGQRAAFITRVRELVSSLELLTLVTPEYASTNLNVIHYDTSRRAKNNATIIQVDLWVQEVRILPSARFEKTQDPSGAKTEDNGRIAAVPVADAAPASTTPVSAPSIRPQVSQPRTPTPSRATPSRDGLSRPDRGMLGSGTFI